MRKCVYWGLLILILYSCIEGISFIGLFLLEKYRKIKFEPINTVTFQHRNILNDLLNQKTNYITYSSTLGWTIKSNGFSDLYRANSKGIRDDREYQLIPPHNMLRISSFGDSFTHCDDVKNEDTWQEKLSKLSPHLEVLNFGVPGYGTDQAFLRYLQDGIQYNSHIILIGFLSENILRNVSVFRPFYSRGTSLPLAKPRFTINDDKLVLFPNPMDELSDYKRLLADPTSTLSRMNIHDYYYQIRYKYGAFDFSPLVRLIKIAKDEPLEREKILRDTYYNEDSEAFQVTARIFDKFYKTVINNSSLPIIIVFPLRKDVVRYWENGTKLYSPLLSYFEAQGYQYIDLLNAFDEVREWVRFKLEKHSMKSLRNDEIPETIVEKLKSLKHQEFVNKNEFLAAIEMRIGSEATLKYQEKILQYARIAELPKLVPQHYSSVTNELVAKYIFNYLQTKDFLDLSIVMDRVYDLKTKNTNPQATTWKAQ